jgi:hypothetical protein
MSPLPPHAIAGRPETALVLVQHRLGLPAQLVLSPNVRLSGLLRVLPPELLQAFVALLTFQGAMGEVRASVEQIAEALSLHPDQAQARLQALSGYTYDGAQVVYLSSERTYALSKRAGVPVDLAPTPPPEPTYRAARREEVIQNSRRRYTRHREEVEAIVSEQLGKAAPEPIPEGREGEAYKALVAAGVADEQARQLLKEATLEEIEAQLAWLPERGARNPGRFLVAAIRGSYDPPPGFEQGGEGDE